MGYLTDSTMPSDKEQLTGLFVTQAVFASNGQTILMGALNKGELALKMETSFAGKTYMLVDIQVYTKHVTSIKEADSGAQGIGIALSNLSTEEAQKMTNKELLFK